METAAESLRLKRRSNCFHGRIDVRGTCSERAIGFEHPERFGQTADRCSECEAARPGETECLPPCDRSAGRTHAQRFACLRKPSLCSTEEIRKRTEDPCKKVRAYRKRTQTLPRGEPPSLKCSIPEQAGTSATSRSNKKPDFRGFHRALWRARTVVMAVRRTRTRTGSSQRGFGRAASGQRSERLRRRSGGGRSRTPV